MNTSATITFKATAGGALEMLTAYEGGYDSENPAHLAAAMLGQKMNDLAERPKHAAVLAEFEAELREICDPEAVDARAKADAVSGDEMGKMQSGMGLPPGFKLPGM